MPSAAIVPPGSVTLPSAPFAIAKLVESKVPSELEQLLVEQTSNVTLPMSFVSGSLKVAVSVGVAVFTRVASAGLTRVGVDGLTFAVLLVTLTPLAPAAGLPVASAVSRTIGSLPGCV